MYWNNINNSFNQYGHILIFFLILIQKILFQSEQCSVFRLEIIWCCALLRYCGVIVNLLSGKLAVFNIDIFSVVISADLRF